MQVLADSGRIAAVHVKPGDTVEVGDLLFELVDAQSAKNASRSVAAGASGVITLMNTVSGAQVYRGQLLCEVADMSTLELSAEVDELDLNSIACRRHADPHARRLRGRNLRRHGHQDLRRRHEEAERNLF